MRLFAIYLAVRSIYLDPGSGSLILQGLVAFLVTVPFVLRSSIRRAISRVRQDRTRRD